MKKILNYQLLTTHKHSWQNPVLDKDLSNPPINPIRGDRYIIHSEAIGDWENNDNAIATYSGIAWIFDKPKVGWYCYIIDEDNLYKYTGTDWIVEKKGDTGEGHITILPLSYDSIGQGTWLTAHYTSDLYYINRVLYNSSLSDGDEISYKLSLDVGTYTLGFQTATSTNRGIVKFYLDDIEVATFDCYSASDIYGSIKKQTNILVSTSGIKTLTIKVAGKNPNSSGYFAMLGYITLSRTV